jgi:hypothetical protein
MHIILGQRVESELVIATDRQTLPFGAIDVQPKRGNEVPRSKLGSKKAIS